MTSRILENKLQDLETLSCDYFMDDAELMSFEPKCEKITEDNCCFMAEDVEDLSKHVTNNVPYSTVEFLDLRDVYEKIQSRAGGGSHQRISKGNINITATSEGQLCGIEAFVQRVPEAATLCGDFNGKVPLTVTHEAHFQNQQTFSFDLDSVYNSPNGTPVYKLATVDAERRNLFIVIVLLKFIDGTKSQPFVSKPFLIRSRKPRSHLQCTTES